MSLFIFVCLTWRVYIQSAMWLVGGIMSLPKNNWPGIFYLFRLYVYITSKSAAAGIPINGSESSTYVSCIFYVRTRFPNNLCILSMAVFSCGFPGGSGLVLIMYSFSVKLFINLWPRNYPPRSYVIYTGHGYRTRHVVSTKFAIVIAFLSLYFITSNYAVMGSIILTALGIRGSFPFLRIFRGL